MDLLERYLKQIERYLPFKERKETIKELRSLILDQVDGLESEGQSKEKALYYVIVEMGEPRDVASKYYDARPMFSKEMEPILMLVLKIVSITLPLVVIFANSLQFIFSSTSINIIDFLLDIAYNIPSALYSLLIAYGFIFIIFFLIERYVQPKFEIEEKFFNPNLLPQIPAKVFKVSIVESIITILLVCGALYVFNLDQGLISIYYNGIKVPLLNSNFDRVLLLMNIGWFIDIALHIFYLFKRKKNIGSKSIEFIHQIYMAVVMIILGTSNIFNETVIEGHGIAFMPNTFRIVMIVLGVFVIISGIVEYVKMFINLDALDELEKK